VTDWTPLPPKPTEPPNVIVRSGQERPAPPTVTTATVVTTTVTPSVVAVPWYRAQRFIALFQSCVLITLGWLIQALTTNDWRWRPVAIALAGNALIQLKDWFSPSVIAPFAVMNKSNTAIKAFNPDGTQGS
jgi:hypothetical protein